MTTIQRWRTYPSLIEPDGTGATQVAADRILVHQPWGGVSGQAVDISIQARELVRIKKLIVSYFAEHTGKTAETVERDLERDYYMSAEEALEYGLIDKILLRGKNGENSQK